jgi:3-phenylpropionate/trans-cinnamate dioxygenase ferredoxin component
MGTFTAALAESELPEGTMAAADVAGTHVLLARIGGEVFAVSGTCTHEATDLGLGFLMEDRVVCNLHLSQFDLRTGAVLNPPATEPLKSFKVKITEGKIFVEV